VDDSKWDGVDGDNKKRKGNTNKMKIKKKAQSIYDYKPILRDEVGIAFDTYGDDLDFVRSQIGKHIWTVVDGDGENPVITAGFHHVNRIHYIITIKPWEDEFLELPYID
jgi:hypothetical protein